MDTVDTTYCVYMYYVCEGGQVYGVLCIVACLYAAGVVSSILVTLLGPVAGPFAPYGDDVRDYKGLRHGGLAGNVPR